MARESAGVQLVPATLASIVPKRFGRGGVKERARSQVAETRALQARCRLYRRDKALGEDPTRWTEVALLRGERDLDRTKGLIETATGGQAQN